jgi:hypothetical protein
MFRTLIKCSVRLAIVVGTLGILLAPAQAQNIARNSEPKATQPNINQAVISLLSTLPDADAVIYMNPQRILNDAAPKLMPEADVAKMRQQFNDLKQAVGVDPSKLDYLVIAVRFRKPGADLSFQSPEFMIVSSGDFSSDSLLTAVRSGLEDKIVEEKYGTKTLILVTIEDLAKQAEKNPLLKSFRQLAVVPLNTNTLAAGNVSYLKAAVDAADGRERINAEMLNSLLRDPNALISITGSPWGSFSKSFGLIGTESNPRTPHCDTKLGDFYAALTMDGTNFRLRGAMNADNPDTAKIISGLLTTLMKTTIPEDADAKSFPSMLKMVNIVSTETEVVLEANFPQQKVADFIREQMKPKPPPEASTIKAPATRPVKKRRATRKH